MSSTPFCIGLQVVDELVPCFKPMCVVLRAKDRQDAWYKIRELQNQMSRKDLIKVYEIGFRPDKPVPVSMHFSEIEILPGEAENYVMCNLVWSWITVITGLKDYCTE